jgi:hypothetical protein
MRTWCITRVHNDVSNDDPFPAPVSSLRRLGRVNVATAKASRTFAVPCASLLFNAVDATADLSLARPDGLVTSLGGVV